MKNRIINRKSLGLCLCILLSITPLTATGSDVKIEINTVNISDITISPSLNISYYGEYNITTNISTDSGVIDTVLLNHSCINGEGNFPCNYFVNGTAETPYVRSHEMNLESGQTYKITYSPDFIYPQIYFAPMNITYYSEPEDKDIYLNNYHLMHFENPFELTNETSLFFEANIVPNSLTPPASPDLSVYLVEQGHDDSYFNSNWKNLAGVELITTINRNTPFDHTHSDNSSHQLIKMTTNEDGTIGTKNLNVSNDFWIILFSNSNTASRGWTIKTHNETVANNTDNWYIGNQLGWTTTYQSGVPDVHVHIIRQDGIIDGVNITIWANDTTGGSQEDWEDFYYVEHINFPPNPSLFITPLNNTYSGLINITWYPSYDPNLDELFYTVMLLNMDGSVHSTIANNISETYFEFDSTTVENGWYDLKVIVSDGIETSDFVLSDQNGFFNIQNDGGVLLTNAFYTGLLSLAVVMAMVIIISKLFDDFDINTIGEKRRK